MTERQKSNLLILSFVWPILLVAGTWAFAAGETKERLKNVEKEVEKVSDLETRLAVAETKAQNVETDVKEIKQIVEAIRQHQVRTSQ